jgi:hypothetical protein
MERTGVGGGAKDRGAEEKKEAAGEEVQDRIVKATKEAPPPKQQVVPDPRPRGTTSRCRITTSGSRRATARSREKKSANVRGLGWSAEARC